MSLTKRQEAIISVLSELKVTGIKSVTTTSLVKFIYLVDYYQAKETEGKTLTETEWTFLHFGPYAPAISEDIEFLVKRGWLTEQSSTNTQKDYSLFSLSEHVSEIALEALGMIQRAATNLRPQLPALAQDLSKLLNFVYFHTEPMEEALPEQVLDFTLCRQDLYKDTKPVVLKQLPADAIKAFKAKLEQRKIAKAQRPKIEWAGTYDEVYTQGMAWLDSCLNEDKPEVSGVLYL